MKDRKIILPDQNGVSNLDIRRMRSELEADAEVEMNGCIPAALIEPCVSALKAVITAIERGEVSSICVVAVMPKSSVVQAGSCFISACGNDLEKIDELFHISLAEQYERNPPDEAG